MIRPNQSLGIILTIVYKKGPSLQTKLWDILIRARFRPVILCADIEKTFLQTVSKRKREKVLKVSLGWVSNK